MDCDVYSGLDCSYSRLPVPDYCGAAAKRKGGGSGRRIWRHGFADSLWPARLGDAAFEGDYDFGDSVHGDVAFAFDSGDAQCGSGNDGTGVGAGEERRSAEDGAGPVQIPLPAGSMAPQSIPAQPTPAK